MPPTKTESGLKVDILLVEDNPADVRLTQEAFREAKVLNRIHVSATGEAALAFLRREGQFSEAPTPDIILLDLNLPRKKGHEVLAEIKSDPALKRIPVIVLSTSQSSEDVLRAYDLHVNCYVAKPIGLEKFLQVVKTIENLWLGAAKLPSK
jgi:CheY-like chemotaxis protein